MEYDVLDYEQETGKANFYKMFNKHLERRTLYSQFINSTIFSVNAKECLMLWIIPGGIVMETFAVDTPWVLVSLLLLFLLNLGYIYRGMSLRKASHAGSWYNESSAKLGQELSSYLEKANPDTAYSSARAIISPHAAFTYCGPTGAYGFKCIDPSTVKTVFVLGPSHHKYLAGCALSKCKRYATPFYNLEVDTQIISTLHKSGMFEDFELDDDEAEHSLEMQLPFIAKIMEGHKDNFKIVPVVVGSTDSEQEKDYGALFAPYLADSSVVFVISSDFCHWGSRFRYCYGANDQAPIWQTITNLDKSGMDIIESRDPGAFEEYLSTYKNTICGRHPIGILLNMVASYQTNNADKKCSIKFLDYSQSSKVTKRSESSVSYASAALIIQ